jgi:hypothetical protein
MALAHLIALGANITQLRGFSVPVLRAFCPTSVYHLSSQLLRSRSADRLTEILPNPVTGRGQNRAAPNLAVRLV